ncbi:MAG: alpha/beta fold hydrolase [Dehalococcoidia bacterium]|nr:alpha/beta fold hydrolase [Dehalococcoidia bacterium]
MAHSTLEVDRLVRHHQSRAGGIRLHYVAAGQGPTVLLLHGFPEFWYAWRYQIPTLVQAGFRVVAPDLRGISLSEKPGGIDAYAPDRHVEDIVALLHHLGEERVRLVGHDYGGGIAWLTAMQHPELVDRLVVLNAPHPLRFMHGLRSWRQRLRSWYVLAFRLPRLPERILGARDFFLLRRVLSGRDAYTPTDIERYVEAWEMPGALTGMLNSYRALSRQEADRIPSRIRPIKAPVLVLWGERDRYLGRELAEPPSEWVPLTHLVRFPRASHFVQADAPDAVNRLLVEFLSAGTTPPSARSP